MQTLYNRDCFPLAEPNVTAASWIHEALAFVAAFLAAAAWDVFKRLSEGKHPAALENRLIAMKALLDDPSRLLAQGISEIMIVLLITAVSVIWVLEDPKQAPEVRLVMPTSFYQDHEQTIALIIQFGSDIIAFVAWFGVMRRARFYWQLANFDRFKETITQKIDSRRRLTPGP